jgi:hypothetical protein
LHPERRKAAEIIRKAAKNLPFVFINYLLFSG